MTQSIVNQNGKENVPNYIAVLDLGTNTCRLLIAEMTPKGPKVVDSFVRIIRLGDQLATKRHISAEAKKRAIDALATCAEKLKAYPLARTRYVATAACREALNREAFLDEILLKTGISVEVISAAEEARLAIIGCSDMLDTTTRYAIAFDIGGGSTEVMWIELFPHKLPEIIEWVSLPLGVVTLAESLRQKSSPLPFLREVRQDVAKKMKSFCDKGRIYPQIGKKNIQLIGTSGTITTLAALHMDLDRYDRTRVNGLYLTSENIKKTIASLYGMTPEKRLLHPCIGPTRAELVLGGVAIFEGIYDVFPINPVRVADRGLREGLLIDLLNNG